MKKQFITCMLVLTGITGDLFAQSKTDKLFSVSGAMPHRLIIQLKNGNSITLQFSDRAQFESLLNLDSILQKVSEDIRPLKDSLANELTNKKVDHLTDGVTRVKIRYTEYPPRGNSYAKLPDGLTPMKVEQDTLSIIYYDARPGLNKPMAVTTWFYRKITVLINNINDLDQVIDGTCNTAMQTFKKEWDENKKLAQRKDRYNLYGFYYAPDPTKSQQLSNISLLQKKYGYAIYVQAALQNVNNIMATSIGLGLQLSISERYNYKKKLQLLWEPYFFFDRKTDGHFKMRRNDFITFQLVQESNFVNRNTGVEFHSNLSIGYLINGNGNYFYDHTFKFGLPGAKYHFMHLYPEFIFNDLFKNFQPGLKLMLDLD